MPHVAQFVCVWGGSGGAPAPIPLQDLQSIETGDGKSTTYACVTQDTRWLIRATGYGRKEGPCVLRPSRAITMLKKNNSPEVLFGRSCAGTER